MKVLLVVGSGMRWTPAHRGVLLCRCSRESISCRNPNFLIIRWIAPMPPQLTALAFPAISA